MPTTKHESQIIKDEHDGVLLARRTSLVSAATIYTVTPAWQSGATVAVSNLPNVNINGLDTPTDTFLSLASAGQKYRLPSTELSNRKTLILYNSSPSFSVWIGGNSLSSGYGIRVFPEEKIVIDASSGMYAIPTANTILLNLLELN